MRSIGVRLAAVALSMLCVGVVLEIGLRLSSRTDSDGNLFVGKLRLRPFHPPIEHIRGRLALRHTTPRPYIRYDKDLGWSVNPDADGRGGLYASNARGIRCANRHQETSLHPIPGRLRIALYGDSFTHGDDVTYEDSWGSMLSSRLTQRGVNVEVLNQGTPGYGMDQAWLRWRKEGRPLKPDIVVFGFQSTDARRNMNLFRNLYSPGSNLTFSKPRFVLEGKSVRLVNAPTPRPDELVEILERFDRWPLHHLEFFYRPENYADSPLYTSRAIAFLSSGLGTRFTQRRKSYDFFAPGGESYELALRIVEHFEREVEASGARFVVLHIPTGRALRRRLGGRDFRYRKLLDAMTARFEVVDPTLELLERARAGSLEALFAPGSGHFSRRGNQDLAQALAKRLAREPQSARVTRGIGVVAHDSERN